MFGVFGKDYSGVMGYTGGDRGKIFGVARHLALLFA
jgi:hypothetical protein